MADISPFYETTTDILSLQHAFPMKTPANHVLLVLSSPSAPFAVYDEKAIKPVSFSGGGDLESCCSLEGVWECEENSILAQFDNAIWKLTLTCVQKSSASGCSSSLWLEKARLVDLRDSFTELDVTWVSGVGVCVVAFDDANESKSADAPVEFPPPKQELSLMVYHPLSGWVCRGSCPMESEELKISKNGRRCVWRVMKNFVPEEAERGEFWVADVGDGEASMLGPTQLTMDAGRVGSAVLSWNGAAVMYTANYSLVRPITTHLDLWMSPWPKLAGNRVEKTKMVDRFDGKAHVARFNFVKGCGHMLLAVHYTLGADMVTELLRIDEDQAKIVGEVVGLHPPVASVSLCMVKDSQFVYGIESMSKYPSVWDSLHKLELPLEQNHVFENLYVQKIEWKASSDGRLITGMLCQSTTSSYNSPLLIHCHGGPAIDMPILRSCAAAASRYPYRHLLLAGYRVFTPHFRGTLGYGDEFSQGNIKSQGDVNGDLGDIMSGLDHLHATGLIASVAKTSVGIFGGSYGGFMTMRALCMYPERFGAGVAMYGFVHGRWMSLESGDFTWEDEYTGPQVWPLNEEATSSDVFEILCKITAPTLFLHGSDDPICPKSQSLIGYRVLQTTGTTTKCVLYPGEKHGFKKPANRKDRDIRVLAWFNEHLPCPNAQRLSR